MAVQCVELRDFTVFREARLDLAAGVNVFLGRNATGKTHAMKALYALLRAAQSLPAEPLALSIGHQLREVFKPDDGALGRLGHRRPGQRTFRVRMLDDRDRELYAQVYSRDGRVQTKAGVASPPPAVFLPSREGLAMHDGFASAYEKRELSFDSTYYDLARALSTVPLRGSRAGPLGTIVSRLQATLGGTLETRGERFYLRTAGGALYEAHLVSEGMRKIGSLLRLVQNGEIAQGSVLLWDEPEANLNPHLAVAVADLLILLAQAGVQVIVATHDYFVSETLAVKAREDEAPATRFFSFVRTHDGSAVVVHHADDLDELPENAIREESLAHYDRLRARA